MERFIDPRTLARVRDLPLVARTVADGFLHGIQPSHQRGVGIEFSQYRAYEPGDDPARIDWKLYARSDRYFVREAERESEIAIWFVLDASRSMAQASEGGAWSKFDYARHLVATLAYLAQGQGDAVGLLALTQGRRHLLPPATGQRQWHRIIKALHGVQPEGGFPDPGDLRVHLDRLQVPGLVLVVSDLHQLDTEIETFLRQASTRHNDVAALQLRCADELQFPHDGPTRFEDLETGETVLVNATRAREGYRQAAEAYQERLRRRLGALEISLDEIDIDQPLDEAMAAFLGRRQRRLVS
ncbi:MAG: DUF58 domain-containing protein [Xanthomonadales bacterium]|jgi:uncharacterized protein (DUF58 family)|nr:DUF58 domain-containing protein [Xanthomonadales bacterium]